MPSSPVTPPPRRAGSFSGGQFSSTTNSDAVLTPPSSSSRRSVSPNIFRFDFSCPSPASRSRVDDLDLPIAELAIESESALSVGRQSLSPWQGARTDFTFDFSRPADGARSETNGVGVGVPVSELETGTDQVPSVSRQSLSPWDEARAGYTFDFSQPPPIARSGLDGSDISAAELPMGTEQVRSISRQSLSPWNGGQDSNTQALPATPPSMSPALTDFGLAELPDISQLSLLASPGESFMGPFELDDGSSEPTTAEEPRSYDIESEEVPAHNYFTPTFQQILQEGITIARKTAEAVKEPSRIAGQDILTSLLHEAEALSSFQAGATRTIAILGDSGHGKSSLINSLLHFPGIAKTSDMGSACTSVVTEYRRKEARHNAPITIEVDRLSTSERRTLITELLWSYRQVHLPMMETVSAEEYAKAGRESAEAWSALEAAFGNRQQFNEQLLQTSNDDDARSIEAMIHGWSDEISWLGDGGAGGALVEEAETAEECCAKTAMFMEDRHWPFTKIIRVYLNAHVLRTGVVLADLPGLQDTNLARVQATLKYLVRCDNIFLVTAISRAITDASLKSSLLTLLKRHVPLDLDQSAIRRLKIAVLCTRSEDIDLSMARNEFVRPGGRVNPSTFRKLEQDITAAKNSRNRALKKSLKHRREILLIEARNTHVKEGLRRSYASKIPGGHLDVFCLSNKMYSKYTAKNNRAFVDASGIPELRKFCLLSTADAQQQEAEHFVQSSLRTLLNSLKVWSTSMSVEQDGAAQLEVSRGVLQSRMEEVSTAAGTAIEELQSGLTAALSTSMLRSVEEFGDAWEADASSRESQWRHPAWHWTQYDAWCRNNGAHSTANKPYVDWNSLFIWKMRVDVGWVWDEVEEDIPDLFDHVRRAVSTKMATLEDDFNRYAPERFHVVLRDGSRSRMQAFRHQLGLLETQVVAQYRHVRRRTEESQFDSFILEKMLPTYRSASTICGPGKNRRQIDVIRGRITDGQLFDDIFGAMLTQISSLVQTAAQSIISAWMPLMSGVTTDVGLALSSLQPVPERVAFLAAFGEGGLDDLATTLDGLFEDSSILIDRLS